MQHDYNTLQQLVREHDYERYLCSLFVPRDLRLNIWITLLFAHEILNIPAITSEMMVGLVKLKWWQEQLSLTHQDTQLIRKDHPLLAALLPLLREDIIPVSLAEQLCQQAADLLDDTATETIQQENTERAITTLYALLSHAAGDAQHQNHYETLGQNHAKISTFRTRMKHAAPDSETPDMLPLAETTKPLKQGSRFLHKLWLLECYWRKRIITSQKRKDYTLLQRLPGLPLRLMLGR